MFTHIVLYKLKDNNEAIKNKLKEKFLSLKDNIIKIIDVEVGFDVLHSERSYDVSLFMRFDNKQDFLSYKEHTYHKKVAEYVHSVKELSVSVDYEN